MQPNSALRTICMATIVFIVSFPCQAFTQIIGFFPPADSISVIGSCVPPSIICHVINQQSGVDTIDIRSPWGDFMYAGSPFGVRIYRCYFAVRDSLDLNHYRLTLKSLWPYPGDEQTVNFDSSMYFMGRFIMMLRVDIQGAVVDSAQARFFADATGNVDSDRPGKPSTTRLLPNFPNPFNPSTTIRYELARESYVSLKAYNILGQEVASLVEQSMPPGFHSVQLNMRGLASGVYLCRLQAGGLIKTSKMLLVQ